MILEVFNERLDEFVLAGVKLATESTDPASVRIVGLHVGGISGYLGFAIHTEDYPSWNQPCIPDFNHSEIAHLVVPEWEQAYWETEEGVQLSSNSPIIPCGPGDYDYCEAFVRWAASRLERLAVEEHWPFHAAIHCVHPVGGDPMISWRPGQLKNPAEQAGTCDAVEAV